MRATEWKRIVRPLLPAGERWEFRRSLCYKAPAGRFLFGVLAESSSFDTGAYLWRLSMPLFLPDDGLDLNLSYSARIGGGAMKYYSSRMEELQDGIRIGLSNLPEENAELHRLVRMGVNSDNIRIAEAAACSQALIGDQAGAIATLKQALQCTPSDRDWVKVIYSRLARLLRTITEEGVDVAARRLDEQAAKTAAVLGIVH